MSANLMSAVFAAKFKNVVLKSRSRKHLCTVPAIDIKFVMLMIADETNDFDEGEINDLTNLSNKTGLNPEDVMNAIKALKQEQVISYNEIEPDGHIRYKVDIEILNEMRSE